MYNVQNIEYLKEDELKMFEQAVEDVRRRGFGEVTLCFRNGYVYRVKVVIDSYNKERANNNENHS